MNIITTQYSLKYKSLETIIAGCRGDNGKHCDGCHSPETWDFNQGDEYQDVLLAVADKVIDYNNMIDWLWVYGGEPLDQRHDELKDMLKFLDKLDKPIVLFTRYFIEQVPDFVKEYCEYIKCGAYISALKIDNNVQYGITLATSNQKIYKKGIDY